jgi:hypothetical protein
VRFVGVDLAWGGRRPSGLAVLDAGGRVVGEGWATSDEEILAFLAAHDGKGAVLALDAPLVVRNPAGTRRGCEAELQRRYGRVGAGPYPTNLGLLGGRVRAMELVRRSGRPYPTVPRDPGRGDGWWAAVGEQLAVGAEQPVELAGGDAEAQPVQRHHRLRPPRAAGELASEPLDLHDGRSHGERLLHRPGTLKAFASGRVRPCAAGTALRRR